MNAFWTPILAVVTVFAVGAGSAAWWHHRRYLTQLRARLEHSEDSRLMLEEEMVGLRQRVDVAIPAVSDDASERRLALQCVLDAAPPRESHWPETQPASMPPHAEAFAPTQPARLGETATR